MREAQPLPLQAVIAPAPAPPEMPLSLTAREREVLAWFAHGRSSLDIGARLGISYKTVQTHRARLLKKLKLKNTFQLSRYAIELTTPRPVPAPPLLIAYRAHSYEREEWPG